MKKSGEQPNPAIEATPAGHDPALDHLEFPVEPNFRSVPPRTPLEEMLKRIEERQPWLAPEYQRRRREERVHHVEFVL